MKANERKLLILAGALLAAVLLLRVLPLIVDQYQEGRAEIARLQQRIDNYRELVENTDEWIAREQQQRATVADLQDWVFSGNSQNLIGTSVQRALRQAAGDAGVVVRDTPLPRYGRIDDWVVVNQEMTFLIDQQNMLRFLDILEASRPRLFVTRFAVTRSRQQYSGSLTVTGFGREI
jgi:hypothetical protein